MATTRPKSGATVLRARSRGLEQSAVSQPAAQPPRSEDGGRPVDPFSVFKGLSGILGPTTLVTGLAFYFGWERTNILLDYFGVDSSLVSFGVQDYLLRSVDGLFTPLVLIFTMALLGLGVHGVVMSAVDQGRHLVLLKWLARGSIVVGIPLITAAIITAVNGPMTTTLYLVPPLSLGAGVLCVSYGVHIWRTIAPVAQSSTWQSYGLIFISLVLISLSLFWATSVYAQAVGRGRGLDIANNLAAQPEAVVYSHNRLGIEATGSVTESAIGDQNSQYRYTYRGLRLLLRSGEKYFLLPADWQQHKGAVVILSDGDAIRLAFITPAGRS